MKYFIFFLVLVSIVSCNKYELPEEKYTTQWLDGSWQMENSSFTSFPQYDTLSFAYPSGLIYMETPLLVLSTKTGKGVKYFYSFIGNITKKFENGCEVKFGNYPYHSNDYGLNTTTLSGTISFENKDKFTFKASGNFVDSLSMERFIDWQVTYNRRPYSFENRRDAKTVQCEGRYTDGLPCKNKTTSTKGFCHLHGG